jgi:pimeloyl-ACP methyl ester carboxylesterase
MPRNLIFLLLCLAAIPAGASEVATRDVVVLVHGLGRTSSSMESLEAELVRAGFAVHNLDYPSTAGDPDAPLRSVSEQIRGCCRETEGRVHFVTHSLGGILVRAYLSEERPENLGRAVFLAPPNSGSEIVDSIGDNALFAAALGPTGQALGTGPESLPRSLPPPDYEVGIIAGNRSINPIGSAIIPGDDDGTVSIESAKLPNAADFLVVDATHTFIMQDTEVARQTIHFLRYGRFAKSGD